MSNKIVEHEGVMNPICDVGGNIFSNDLIIDDTKPIVHAMEGGVMILMGGFNGGTISASLFINKTIESFE